MNERTEKILKNPCTQTVDRNFHIGNSIVKRGTYFCVFNIIIHSLWKTYKYFVESNSLRKKTHKIFVSNKQQIVEKLCTKDRCTDSTSALLDISRCFLYSKSLIVQFSLPRMDYLEAFAVP